MNKKIIYWIVTGLLCAMMLMSASMYFLKYDEIATSFQSVGHPVHLIYPLAIAKILGVTALLTNKSKLLSEWAYAGFFFVATLAGAAHLNAGDGHAGGAAAAIVLVVASRYFWPFRTT